MQIINTHFQPPVIDTANPYPAYRYLQQHLPVYKTGNGHWMITRYEDAAALLQDARCKHWGQQQGTIMALPPVERAIAAALYTLSPDSGQPHRKHLLHQLAGKQLATAENDMQQLASELLQPLRGEEEIDFMSAFAHPYTFGSISQLIGVPIEQQVALCKITAAMDGSYLACIDPATAQTTEHGKQFIAALRQFIKYKLTHPGNDLCTVLLEHSTPDAGQEQFMLSLLILLFYAGHQNMMNLLGNALLLMHEQPVIQQQLQQPPGLLRAAIDELIRLDSPLQYLLLIAQETIVLHDQVIPSGSQLLIAVGAANRDPSMFPKPDQFQPGRRPGHLGFGAGAFRCIGARLAQLQAAIGLHTWQQMVKTFQPIQDQLVWRSHPFVQRGPAYLPVKISWHE